MTSLDAEINRAYATYASQNGLQVKLGFREGASPAAAGRELEISAGDGVSIVLEVEDSKVTYLESTRIARAARLDAPLLRILAEQSQVLRVDIPLPGLPPEVPKQVGRMTLGVVPLAPGRDDLEARVVMHDLSYVPYQLGSPAGLEDLTLVAEDALMLAEPCPDHECEGPHGSKYAPAAMRGNAALAAALTLHYRLCVDCVNTLVDMDAPLAPRTPKEWD